MMFWVWVLCRKAVLGLVFFKVRDEWLRGGGGGGCCSTRSVHIHERMSWQIEFRRAKEGWVGLLFGALGIFGGKGTFSANILESSTSQKIGSPFLKEKN